jgi:hypothetical protein
MLPTSTIRSLALQAFDGWDIPNGIDPPPSAGYLEQARRGANRLKYPTARLLIQPTGRYNCHGQVFGNRRTNIPPAQVPDAVDVDELLGKDGYRRIDGDPDVGDLVVYRAANGAIDHAGIVVRLEKVEPTSKVRIPYIWSTWGGMGEYEHHVAHTPYGDQVEYWRHP